jgi:hypothetical protein
MARRRNSLRVSDSIYLGPFRFRVSVPLTGRGRVWGSAGVRTGRRQWTSISSAFGGSRQRRP